eukprot:TRINITY_DN3779_c0_g1_i22.p1 TRINITY_DN3779_c0_g1~~TRINITY_DN3779_c0_g1_i22.p1  ORF type:complete len:222 (+),score=42.41 TRINITY_DN3779_c0_g1_i22:74-739(+)
MALLSRVRYEVEPGLLIGDAATAAEAAADVRCRVLDVGDAAAPVQAGCQHRVERVRMDSSGSATDLWVALPACFTILGRVMLGHDVIVCCESGRNQSVVVVLAYLVVCRHLPLAQAVDYVQTQFHANAANKSLPVGAALKRTKLPMSAHSRKAAAIVRSRRRSEGSWFLDGLGCPAPEPCYLRKLLEVEVAFRGSSSIRCAKEPRRHSVLLTLRQTTAVGA